MLRIGEFSRATSLTVKTIRLYHEEGLLPPAKLGASGYRYYDGASVERARAIVALRRLGFSLAGIREALAAGDDEADVLEILERRLRAIDEEMAQSREARRSLMAIIRKEREAKMAEDASFDAVEKVLDPVWIAGIRTKGKYAECGKLFGKLARTLRSRIRGKPMNLYHDGEYREDDADFESCFPVAAGTRVEGASVRELPGGRFVCLLHRGPYEEIGRSYRKLFESIEAKGLEPAVPSREVYVKGPGMIFRGNPKKYLTEIQVPVESRRSAADGRR
jgi:DNA-binding transcriptional MerR regulator/effector-binding domain-containing protein